MNLLVVMENEFLSMANPGGRTTTTTAAAATKSASRIHFSLVIFPQLLFYPFRFDFEFHQVVHSSMMPASFSRSNSYEIISQTHSEQKFKKKNRRENHLCLC